MESEYNHELKMCTGCGHLSDESIEPPALGCCPDSSYRTIPDFFVGILKSNRNFHKNRIKELEDGLRLIKTYACDPEDTGIKSMIDELLKERFPPFWERIKNKQIESLKAELKRLKLDSENNPFCTNCKEPDCLVSLDGTCEMIRVYLQSKARHGWDPDALEKLKKEMIIFSTPSGDYVLRDFMARKLDETEVFSVKKIEWLTAEEIKKKYPRK